MSRQKDNKSSSCGIDRGHLSASVRSSFNLPPITARASLVGMQVNKDETSYDKRICPGGTLRSVIFCVNSWLFKMKGSVLPTKCLVLKVNLYYSSSWSKYRTCMKLRSIIQSKFVINNMFIKYCGWQSSIFH